MALRRRALASLGLAWADRLRSQPTGPLMLLVDSATEMPMARLEGDRVVGGMTLELAQLLAARMGRSVEGIARPRRRLQATLQTGEADWICTYRMEWLPGNLQWSTPFFEQDEVIVSRADATAPRQLTDLAGQPIGTVLGFVYEDLEVALGKSFRRDDAPNAPANLRKLAAGRTAHAVVSLRLLEHQRRTGQFSSALHPPLLMRRYLTQCALRPGAPVSLQQLNQAIEQIQRDGSLRALYRRYDADSTRSNSRP